MNISVKEKYSTEYVECYCEYSILSGYDVHPGSETRQLSLEGTFSDLSPPFLFFGRTGDLPKAILKSLILCFLKWIDAQD